MGAPDLPLGLVYDLPIEQYHGGPGISKSGLDELARSPAIYRALRDPKAPPREDKAGQLEGNLAHCAILEPAFFDMRYAVGPSVNRNTKVWKEFVASEPVRVAIQQDQHDAAMRQAESVLALPELRDALSLGRAEVSAYWIDQATGVHCRCRPDWVHPLENRKAILVDVKTCGDASPREFVRQAARKRYDVQDAFYSDGFGIAGGLEVVGFIFAAVETVYPYAACAVMLDDASRESGRRKYRRDLDTFARCTATGKWPGYSDAIELVSLPSWSLEKELSE